MKRVLQQMMLGAAASMSAQVNSEPRRIELGISETGWTIVTQGDRWQAVDRPTVQRSLQEVASASLTVAGLPDTGELLAEEAAVIIAGVVHPVNWRVACTVLRPVVEGTLIMDQPELDHDGSYPRVTERRLRALVYYAYHNLDIGGDNAETPEQGPAEIQPEE